MSKYFKKLRVEEDFRKKCEAGYDAALKEFIENMTPDQKADYENIIDSNI